MITAPYNFVPLNEKVFYPSWADEVSHDIPFEDGQSGQIDITITAKSPIFIKDSKKGTEEFCHYKKNGKKEYYIPGSSVKGVIRTISEILSFAKFNIQDRKLSYRDLKNPSYEKNAMTRDKIYMGWLYKKDDEWHIDSLGTVTKSNCRIKYTHMEKYFNSNIIHRIKNEKYAYKKYKIIGDFEKLKLDIGTIVFTGSTGKRKTREFLFPNKIENRYILDEKVVSNFKEAYYIDTPNESLDWKNLWKNKFKNNHKVPVFFQVKDDEIIHFGLSMLYKLPYKYSTMELVKNYTQNYDDNKIDLVERIFGFVKEDKALKSRISFSHFKAIDVKKYDKKVSLPLSTPRPTFYPNYLVQCGKDKTEKLITYDNKNSILRGYKFYIPKNQVINNIQTNNKNILTSFYPLDSNTIFRGKLKYFNLKQEELGLVLLALSILKDDSYYKIGMGKPYGFGNCHISINNLKDFDKFIEQYVKFINSEFKIDLLNHPRIKALKELSKKKQDDSNLQYMDIKGFTNAKAKNHTLNEVVLNSYNKDKLCTKNNLKQNKQKSYNKQNKNVNYNKSKSISENLLNAWDR